MEYSYNDNELIYMINEDSDEYLNILLIKYKPIIYSISNEFYLRYKNYGVDFDDLVQEAMIGFNKALGTFNSNDSLFYTYSVLCIKRNIISYLRKFCSKKNDILNMSLGDEFINNCYVLDDDVFLSDVYEYKFVLLKNYLSFDDSIIFELKYNNFTSEEISILLDIPKKKINKMICKIKLNLKKQTENNI